VCAFGSDVVLISAIGVRVRVRGRLAEVQMYSTTAVCAESAVKSAVLS
jgi:hypothetical protein